MKKWFVLALIACMAVGVQAGEGADKKKGEGKPVSKEQFVAQQKKMAEKKGTEYDQAKAEAKFDKMDKNQDGKLTADEKPKKKGKKGKKGKGDKDKKAAE
jgi:hypothetical protein